MHVVIIGRIAMSGVNSTGQNGSIPSARVLVVDDERSIRLTLKAFLARAGYEVEAAEDGAEALRLLTAGKFDVVLSDLILPRISGLELLENIRHLQPETRVIMMTGMPDDRTSSQADSLGTFGYLSKPVDIQDMLALVARAVSGNVS